MHNQAVVHISVAAYLRTDILVNCKSHYSTYISTVFRITGFQRLAFACFKTSGNRLTVYEIRSVSADFTSQGDYTINPLTPTYRTANTMMFTTAIDRSSQIRYIGNRAILSAITWCVNLYRSQRRPVASVSSDRGTPSNQV